MDRVLAPLGATLGDGEGVAGTATSRWSWPLGTRESLMAEPPNKAAATAALTTTAALAEAIRKPLLVTLPSSCTTTPEQVTT
jgi:hypothetical protein